MALRFFLLGSVLLSSAWGNRVKTKQEQVKVIRAGASNGEAEYDAWRKIYRPDEEHDGATYTKRLAIFNERRKHIEAHNARPGVTWKESLNHLSDYTPEEFNALLGYKRHISWRSRDSARSSSSSFLEVKPDMKSSLDILGKTVDWRSGYETAVKVKNQGSCGSCWAAATTGVLEWHTEKLRREENAQAGSSAMETNASSMDNEEMMTFDLSVSQLVDCTQNKKHCGGNGGCAGATAELALDYAAKHVLLEKSEYQGDGHWGGDKDTRNHCTSEDGSQSFIQAEGPQPDLLGIKVTGWLTLPINKYAPLMQALATQGPIVVSVDAGRWSSYQGGIFSGCTQDTIVNHAVVLAGYGSEMIDGKQELYWLIRNSWGPTWGENGYIRMKRHEGDIDNPAQGYCGQDTDNQEGVGCENDPKVITVCGMCGILSDSAYPTGITIVGRSRLKRGITNLAPPLIPPVVQSMSISSSSSSSVTRNVTDVLQIGNLLLGK